MQGITATFLWEYNLHLQFNICLFLWDFQNFFKKASQKGEAKQGRSLLHALQLQISNFLIMHPCYRLHDIISSPTERAFLLPLFIPTSSKWYCKWNNVISLPMASQPSKPEQSSVTSLFPEYTLRNCNTRFALHLSIVKHVLLFSSQFQMLICKQFSQTHSTMQILHQPLVCAFWHFCTNRKLGTQS